MKMIKNLFYIAYLIPKQFFCKHVKTYTASCPYTRKAYTDCARCFKRLSVATIE